MAAPKHKVLIADDYEADRFFLKELIRRHAPLLDVVAEVEDGEDVIAYLWGYGQYADRAKYPFPDLLIMDVRMPRMTGIQVLEWLKTQNLPPMKIAVLADSSSAIYRDRIVGLGLAHFYSKLIDPGELAKLVVKLQSELEETAGAGQAGASADSRN